MPAIPAIAAALPYIAAGATVAAAGYSIYQSSQVSKIGPDPIVMPGMETADAGDVQSSAETAGENAVIKEAERRRRAKGALASIVTGARGDTSAAPVLKQTLGGA